MLEKWDLLPLLIFLIFCNKHALFVDEKHDKLPICNPTLNILLHEDLSEEQNFNIINAVHN